MKKILPALLLSIALFTQTALASFEDVDASHPYYEGISYLELIGAVDPGTNFRPDDLLSKAEFFKMLFKGLREDLEAGSEKTAFTDVPTDAWYKPYASLAEFHDLTDGTLFEAQKNLTRANVLGLVMKAYGLSAPIIPVANRSPLFDNISVKHPLYSLLYQADKVGLIEADPSEDYIPFEKITRGELADMIYRVETWKNEALAADAESDFYKSDIFVDVWNRILNEFYLPDGYQIDQDVLFQAAVDAVLESLGDPFSQYFPPDQATEFTGSLEGEFEGIGAILNQDAETLNVFIAEILGNTPAEDSDLEAGDQIIAVDDISIVGMPLEEVMARIKGAAGTEVRITILREGTEHTYLLIRATIQLDLVKGKIYHKDTWFIDIDSFGADIFTEMEATLADLNMLEPDPTAITLDLRSNPGGYVNMGNYVAGLFLPHLTPLVILDYGGPEETIYNGDYGPYQDVPVYILVDEYTASASEILSLILQESGHATIIGTQTYGKGSAQEIITYWDGSLLKLTIAHWLSSKGTSIEGVGLTPDILVTPGDGEEDEWLKALNEEL